MHDVGAVCSTTAARDAYCGAYGSQHIATAVIADGYVDDVAAVQRPFARLMIVANRDNGDCVPNSESLNQIVDEGNHPIRSGLIHASRHHQHYAHGTVWQSRGARPVRWLVFAHHS